LARSSSASGRCGKESTHVRQKIEGSFGRRIRHASSAVNDNTGAISRSSASRMRTSAVCAERRARLSAAVV
jgi:hypothetical protein